MAPSTRDRLLDAGLRAFATRGVDGTAIVDLEEAAGLAPGSGGFYRYYRTKDELLDAAVRREIDRVIAERGDLAPSPAGTPRDRLTAEFERALETLDSLGSLIAVLARERARVPGLAREIADRLLAGGVRHDEELVANARGGTGANAAAGSVVLSAVVGYHLSTQYFGGAPGGVDRAAFVDALTDLVLGPDGAASPA